MTVPRGHIMSVGQIADMLASRALNLCEQLLPNGRREGHEWFVGSVAGEPGKSMAVSIGGAKAGVWCDFASGETGDALDLVGAVQFGGDKKSAVDWAKSWLGIDGLDPGRLAMTRAAVANRAAAPDAAAEDAKRRESAWRMFRGGKVTAFKGSLAERYLRQRGIDFGVLGRQPGCIGTVPALWCGEANAKLPALLASITIGAQFVGVHRTWLDADTGGKARVTMPKKTLGRYRGGCIALWRPDGTSRWADLWETGEDAALVVTEGIENGLSVAMANPDVRVVAAVALKNIAALQLPPGISEFTIAADNDAGVKEQAALDAAIMAHRQQGRRVRVARAPAPHKDFNDWLQALVNPGQTLAAGGLA